MFYKAIFIAPAVFLGLTACDQVRDEIYSPGGFVAVQADRYQKAVTPGQHVDRYRTYFNFVAPLALTAAYDDESVEAAIEDVAEAWQALEALEAAIGECAYDPRGLAFCQGAPLVASGASTQAPGIKTFAASSVNFEALSLRLQRELGDLSYRMAENIGVRLSIEDFDVGSISTLFKSLYSLRDQTPTLRKAAATFRDMTHIYVRSVALACTEQTPVETAEDPVAAAGQGEEEAASAAAAAAVPAEPVKPAEPQTRPLRTGKCEALHEELDQLYRVGQRYWQPSLSDEAPQDRRLKRVLNLAKDVIEQRRAAGPAAGAQAWRYWEGGVIYARGYIAEMCHKKAESLSEGKDDASKECTQIAAKPKT